MENAEKLRMIYGDDECDCIHPDSHGWTLPLGYLRENIRSLKDPICNFCGDRCQGKTSETDPKFLHHTVGENFIYCPIKSRALKITDLEGNPAINTKTEICPFEIGGCGLYIPQVNPNT